MSQTQSTDYKENMELIKSLKHLLDQNKLKELYDLNKKNKIQSQGNIKWAAYKKQYKDLKKVIKDGTI